MAKHDNVTSAPATGDDFEIVSTTGASNGKSSRFPWDTWSNGKVHLIALALFLVRPPQRNADGSKTARADRSPTEGIRWALRTFEARAESKGGEWVCLPPGSTYKQGGSLKTVEAGKLLIRHTPA